MFCNKCGKELDQNGKCPNCDYNEVKPEYSGKKKKRKKSGCLIVLILILCLILTFTVIVPFVKNKIAEHKQNRIEALMELTSSEKIGEDFESGNITADEYIKQLAYEAFDKSKMNSKYQSNNNNFRMFNNVFEEAEKYQNELSDDTIIYLYKKACLSDTEFTTNPKKGDSGFSEYGAVYAASHDDSLRTSINKVKLSKNKQFLIWYTDTGDSKVKDKDVEKLADEIEDTVKKIEDNYNITYKYTATSGTGSSEQKKTKDEMKKILKENDIDEKYIDEVMNIYICYTNMLKNEETAALAYYVPQMEWLLKKASAAFDDGSLGEITSVPHFPYVNVSPSSLKDESELKLVYTHELFHHFQKLYCGDGKFVDPKAGEFTVETTANWGAASLNDSKNKDNIMSDWATRDVLKSDTQLDKVQNSGHYGYAGLCFAKVYEDVVDDGKTKLLESMKYKDAMKYLVESAGDKFSDVMVELAKRNVTNDYEHQTFKSNELPENSLDLTMELSKNEELVSSYAMKYYYLEKSNFKYNTYVDVVPSMSNYLNYVIFGEKSGKYVVIESGNIGKEGFTIETDKYFKDYNKIIFAVVNAKDLPWSYTITTVKEKVINTIKAGQNAKTSLNRRAIFDKGEYMELHVDSFTSILKSLTNFGKELGTLGTQETDDEDVKNAIEKQMSELDRLDKDIDEFNKANLNVVRVYSIPIDKSVDKNSLHSNIKDSYPGMKFKIVDITTEDNARITVGAVLNLFSDNKYSFYVVCTPEIGDSFAYFVEVETKK